MKSKLFFIFFTLGLLFLILATPTFAQQIIRSNPFCTKVGSAEDSKNPCQVNLGNLTYYCQRDPRWTFSPYSCQNLGAAGCGPSSTAMLLTAFGVQVNPVDVAKNFSDMGFDTCGEGTAMEAALGARGNRRFIDSYGLDVGPQLVDRPSQRIDEALAKQFLSPGSGYLIIGSSPSFPSCNCNHIFVVQSVDASGNFIIRDPINCDFATGQEKTDRMSYKPNDPGGIKWLYAYPVKKVR